MAGCRGGDGGGGDCVCGRMTRRRHPLSFFSLFVALRVHRRHGSFYHTLIQPHRPPHHTRTTARFRCHGRQWGWRRWWRSTPDGRVRSPRSRTHPHSLHPTPPSDSAPLPPSSSSYILGHFKQDLLLDFDYCGASISLIAIIVLFALLGLLFSANSL
jgi:hypothetical protein